MQAGTHENPSHKSLIQTTLTRRRFFYVSAVATSATLLAACGGDDEAPPATTAPQPTQAAAPTTAPAATAATSGGTTAATPAGTPVTQVGQSQGNVVQLPQTAAPGKAGGKKIFRAAATNDVQNMDPAKITGAPDYQLGEAIYNFIGRYTYNPPLGTDIIPELAEKWDISPDAKTFTFYLRKGAKFHGNYGDVDAEEVINNWKRIQDPATASRYATDFAGASFQAVDATTVKVAFEKAYPAFIQASLAFRPGLIISTKALAEKGDAWKTAPIGSGPFQWGKLEAGTSVTMDRFDGYWGQKPKVDQIIYRFKVDDRAAVLAVATGELDAFYIDDPDIALEVSRRTDPNTTFIKAAFGSGTYWFAFNLKKAPLTDVRVRHALRYAIDVNAIAKELFGGLVDPIHSFLPPFMWGYSDKVTKFNYEPDRAKNLLKEANVDLNSWQPSAIGDGASTIARQIGEAVGSFWTDVGVKVKMELLEGGTFLERRRAGDYDMFGIGVGRIEPDQVATPYWHSSSPSTANNSFYGGADALIEQAKSEPDVNKRKELYAQLQEKMSQDSPAAFIISTSSHLLVNKRVAGLAGAGWQTRIDWFNVDVPAE